MAILATSTTTTTVPGYASSGTPAAGSSALGAGAPVSTAAALANAALSGEAAIVATLGGNRNQVQTYDASGLLARIQQIEQAGAATPSSGAGGSDAPSTSDPSTSTPSGADTDVNADVNASWASILKTRPDLAGVAIGYAFDEGIVSTLSTWA